ncbi:hypothetical protein [Ramlibacter tataouinensis]|uniref:Uncharacterized protein n=1 Tax=Ramlibacter tataouinensis (strain ATCC BAA-407 / DSM 14655 / LMG 21543 / TTB310) TaxID=365046 RepID=F5XXZ5_RAMTT|nr:hypothetical protein [Ramlibacter tataouinensis]AEG94320.1 hypothetical protein Rta_32090 [Ramlibacter tataouinensis TTB310]
MPATPNADATSIAARGRLLWTVLGSLVALQLLAFYMLVSHQVRKAQARDAQVQVERMALHDCLQYVANSTIGSCTTRMTQRAQAPAPVPASVVEIAVR